MRVMPPFVCLYLLLAGPAAAAQLDAIHASNEMLIDALVGLNSETPGIDQMGEYSAFMAEDGPPRFEVGVLGPPAPSTPPAMRELVRRGLAALPDLLRHLDDARPTGLSVGGNDLATLEQQQRQARNGPNQFMFMDELKSGEYDARIRTAPWLTCDGDCSGRGKEFSGPYVVKVGDICFVLVGQIVDRMLLAVRYQPTAILVINSPIETPDLARKTRQDWSGLTVADHRASLLADLRAAEEDEFAASGALARLRFYYPDAYAALSGDDAKKRDAFEAEEKKEARSR
jgi:hypothetical protein